MSIRFSCPCGKSLGVKDEHAGKKVRCPSCLSISIVPQLAAARVPTALPFEEGKTAYRPSPAPIPRRMAESLPDEPEPREIRRPKSPKRLRKRSQLRLVIALSVAALLILLLAGGGLAWWLISPSGLSNEVYFLPDDCELIASVNVAAVANSDLFKALMKEGEKSIPDLDKNLKDFEKDIGLSMADIKRVTIGMVFPRREMHGPPELMVLIKTRKAVALGDVFKGSQFGRGRESKIGSFTVRQFENDASVCLADSKTILVSPPDMMSRILKRDKKATISAGMQQAMNNADFTQAVTVALSMRELWKDAFKGTDLRRDLEREVNIDADKLLQLLDMSILHLRLGPKVEIDAQVLGSDFKASYTVSIKSDTLISMFNKGLPQFMPGDPRPNRPDMGFKGERKIDPPLKDNLNNDPGMKDEWKKDESKAPLPKFAGVPIKGFPQQNTLEVGKARLYQVNMRAGKTYVIDLKSQEFDAYLRLRSPTGQLIAENDDFAGLDSRIVFNCVKTQTYQIEATSLGGSGAGAYVLDVREQ